MIARRLPGALLVAALSFTTLGAGADDRGAAAQAAFDEATVLMDKGNYDAACAKYEESQKLDAGMATQFRLAECYEKAERLASAWKNFTRVAAAARAAGMTERETFAQKRADALEPKLIHLDIRVPDEVAAIEGLRVAVDGKVVGDDERSDLPVDRGRHEIEVTAPYHESFSTEVVPIRDGETVTVDVPPLVSKSPEADDGSTLLIVGLAAAGLGAAGMGVGIGLGAKASSDYDGADELCDGTLCNAEGLEIRDDARSLGNIGTGVFIAGAVVAAAGVGMALGSLAYGQDDEVALRVHLLPSGGRFEVTW